MAVLERAQGVRHHLRRQSCGQDVGPKPTVLIAGDDTAAEPALAVRITAGGVRAIDGGLARADELEAVGFLQLTLAAETISWTGGFGVVP